MPYLKPILMARCSTELYAMRAAVSTKVKSVKFFTHASLYCFPTLGAKGGVQLGAGKIMGNGVLGWEAKKAPHCLSPSGEVSAYTVLYKIL